MSLDVCNGNDFSMMAERAVAKVAGPVSRLEGLLKDKHLSAAPEWAVEQARSVFGQLKSIELDGKSHLQTKGHGFPHEVEAVSTAASEGMTKAIPRPRRSAAELRPAVAARPRGSAFPPYSQM